MLTAAEPVISADKITKAAGETFKGKDSGHIKINEVKEEDGKLTLKFEVEQPKDVIPAGGGGPIGGFGNPTPLAPPPRPRAPAPAPAAPRGTGVAFQAPPAAPAAPAAAPIRIQIQIGPGAAPGATPFVFQAPGITLVDEKGKAIPQTGGAPPKYQFVPGGQPKVEYTQEYKLDKDQKPAKLVLSASKTATLEIPFTFKDVPLK